MPKKPFRDNPRKRANRTIYGRPQSAGRVLQRIKTLADVAVSTPGAPPTALIEELRALIPAGLHAHVIGALAKPGEVVAFADSAAWAARLKLALADAPPRSDGRRVTVRVLPQS